jgi:hypothetical protein
MVDAAEALNEHVAQVIQGLRALPVDECRGERIPLGRGQALRVVPMSMREI